MEVETLLKQLESVDLKRREEAADALRQSATTGWGVPVLFRALRHRKGRVRREAARALGRMRASDPEVCEGLAQMLLERSDRSKEVAFSALSRIGSAATAAVLDTLTEANSRQARSYIIQTLGALRSPLAQEALQAIFWEEHGLLEKYAARALGQIDFQWTLHHFSEEARGWGTEERRQKARRGLIQLGVVAPDPIELIDGTIMGGDALTAFEISQGMGNSLVLQGAIRGLGERKSEKGIPYILDALGTDDIQDAPTIQEEATRALRAIGSDEVYEEMLRACQDKRLKPWLRSLLAEQLLQTKRRWVWGRLNELIGTEGQPLMVSATLTEALLTNEHPPSLLAIGQALSYIDDSEREGELYTFYVGQLTAGIGQLAPPEVEQEERLMGLRELLSLPPSPELWEGVCVYIAHWPEAQDRDMAVDYAFQHKMDWNERLGNSF